jgi:hypothetical protein
MNPLYTSLIHKVPTRPSLNSSTNRPKVQKSVMDMEIAKGKRDFNSSDPYSSLSFAPKVPTHFPTGNLIKNDNSSFQLNREALDISETGAKGKEMPASVFDQPQGS